MEAHLHALLDWISAHPWWAGIFTFAIAALESLLVVGLLVPGAILLFGIGALTGLGILDFWTINAWATAGAICGDGVSFALGRHYGDRLTDLWPLRRYPGLVARGHGFFSRHGGKSVIFGRFVGAVRPIIPGIAGMAGMPPSRFLLINVASAIVWAPAYLLPGLVFGSSLQLAAEVATRLATLIVLVAAAIWVLVWLVHRLARFLQPRLDRLLLRVFAWLRGHPVLARVTVGLVQPRQRAAPGLAVFALVLAAISLIGAALGHLAFGGGAPSWVDGAVATFMTAHRVASIDYVMHLLAGLAGPAAALSAMLAVTAWLIMRRDWSAATYLAASAAFGLALAALLAMALARLHGLAPPGGSGWTRWARQLVLSASVLGFLAGLAATHVMARRRWLIYLGLTLLLFLSLLGRLYLERSWLTVDFGEICLGLAWALLLVFSYRHHRPARRSAGLLLGLSMLGLLATLPWQPRPTPASAERLQTLARADWLERGWRTLPTHRIDLEQIRRHPLELQWAGSVDALAETLQHAGWVRRTFRASRLLRILAPHSKLDELPLMPLTQDGQPPVLTLSRLDGPDREWVLRLWDSHWRLADGRPLRVGMVSTYQRQRIPPLIVMAAPARPSPAALETVHDALSRSGLALGMREDARGRRVLLAGERSGKAQ